MPPEHDALARLPCEVPDPGFELLACSPIWESGSVVPIDLEVVGDPSNRFSDGHPVPLASVKAERCDRPLAKKYPWPPAAVPATAKIKRYPKVVRPPPGRRRCRGSIRVDPVVPEN